VEGNTEQKLLSISIPTYNRAEYLDLCLSQICKQLPGKEHLIEVIVSDNASTDNTGEIVRKYIQQGSPVKYVRNGENIGMDGNIVQAYTLATAKYVLVFGDDDALLDGAIDTMLKVLRSGEYGIVFVSGYPYHDMASWATPPEPAVRRFRVYRDKKKFVEKINYHFTYCSGNIVNKTLVSRDLIVSDFIGTYVALLSWTFSALFNSRHNAYIEEFLIAAKADNSGGYRFCTVFGKNVNIVFDYFIQRGFDRRYFDVINRKLLFYYFPSFIRNARKGKHQGDYLPEDYYQILYPVFRTYAAFWLFTAPAIWLPRPLLKILFIGIRHIRKALHLYQKVKDLVAPGFQRYGT
jgi:glycosyltransferase involved in cell wall biosynthesis